jgi:nucleotide-binding universal stress UspA family protein
LRPEADYSVSVPGQYAHLENHIEAYRFVLETTEGRELSFEEAVNRWFDDVYLPLVEAIREQGILRYFPGRTETDFFIWLTRHRLALQKELGLTITPDVAVSRLISRVNVSADAAATAKHPLFSRLRRLTHLSPADSKPPPVKSWAEERKLNRYSDTLFGHILFPVAVADEINRAREENRALKVAQEIATRENAQLCVLCVKLPEKEDAAQEACIERLRSQIERDKSLQGFTEVLVESGDAARRALDLAYLHDLIVLDRGFNGQADRSRASSPKVYDIIRHSTRPLFIVGANGAAPTLTSVLLVHDTRRRFDEALFIAAYLAERWKPELAVLPISNGRNTEEILTRIRDYLGLHEINALFLEPVRPTNHLTEAIVDAAQATACDLILLSGSGHGRDGRRSLSSEIVVGLLERWQKSVLLAT